MKKILIILLALILIATIFNACSSEEEEMDMRDKIWYIHNLDFILQIYIDGQWLNLTQELDSDGNSISMVWPLLDPQHESFADFYTEIRFVHFWEETADLPTNVIAAFPFEPARTGAVNALNWETESAGVDLKAFGLSYPITVENLVDDYEAINRLIRHDWNFTSNFTSFLRGLNTIGTSRTRSEWEELQRQREAGTGIVFFYPDSRIAFELLRLGEWNDHLREQSDEKVEKVLAILDQLNMTQDEAGPILRAAGSFDAFVAVTDLMLTQGLSAEDALARYRR